MSAVRTTLAAAALVAVAAVLVSGGSGADPRTPPARPGEPPPFLPAAVLGSGGTSAAVDAYGDIADLRAGPAGPPLIHNPADRQTAGTVSPETGIVPWVRVQGRWRPPWSARAISQRYLPASSVLVSRLGYGRGVSLRVVDAASGGRLGRLLRVSGPPGEGAVTLDLAAAPAARCREERRGDRRLALVCSPRGSGGAAPGRGEVFASAAALRRRSREADRSWLARRRPLGAEAPPWARALYGRSLLVLRSLLDRRTGALAAGARDGWAYVWPRDAATAALALASAGYRPEARRIARFLAGLDLTAAARFDGEGEPVPGRGPQGDAAGWVAAAARAASLAGASPPARWRGLPDYREGEPGDYLGNAIAARRGAAIERLFETPGGLVRAAEEPASGLDSAAAWAVRPFPQPRLFAPARRTMLRLAAAGCRFGIVPGEGWRGGEDPWTAPTAWTAWSLAALAREQRGAAAARDRGAALALLADLRRAATPLGLLPERVDAQTGVATSTTPLPWSHAFAVLALRALWPSGRR